MTGTGTATLRALLPAMMLVGCSAPTPLADVSYDDRFGAATTLDLFLPPGGGPAPAVVFVHGGLFQSGDKAEFRGAAARLAASGYVTATVNHRLSPGAPFPAPVRDVGCALAFLRRGAADYGIEPDRIAIVGYASGGYFAAMLGVAGSAADLAPDCAAGPTDPPAAVVASAGLYDLTLVAGKKEVRGFLDGTVEEVPERYAMASPLLRVAPGTPPFLLIQGEFDFVVPPEQAHLMKGALEANGDPVELLSLFDPGHFLAAGADNGGLYGGGVRDRPEAWIALADFLERTIGRP